MFKKFKLKLFIKLCAFYISTIVLPFVLFSTIILNVVLAEYRSDITKAKMNVTSYISSVMDSDLYYINKAESMFSKSSNVVALANRRNLTDINSRLTAKALAGELSRHYAYSNQTSNIGLSFDFSETVVDSETMYTYPEYYERYFKYSNYSYEYILDLLRGKEAAIVLSYIQPDSLQPYITSFKPILASTGLRATLISTIVTPSVFESYKTLTAQMSDSYFFIANSEKILLSSEKIPMLVDLKSLLSNESEQTVRLPGNFLAVYHNSIVPELKYIYFFSESEILAKVDAHGRILTMISLCIIVSLIIIAYFCSLRTFSPVNAIISNSNETATLYSLDNYSSIQALITDTINTNNSLRNTVDRQKKCMDSNLFKMFMQNSMDLDAGTVETLFESNHEMMIKQYYHAVIVHINNAHGVTENIAKLTVLSNIRTALNDQKISLFVIPNDLNKIILLVNYDGDITHFLDTCTASLNSLRKNNDFEISMHVGRRIDNLCLFSKTYEDALYSVRDDSSGVQYCENSSQMSCDAFLSSESKDILTNSVRCGNSDMVLSFFDEFVTRIFIENTLTYRMLSYLRFYLSNLINEIIASGHFSPSETAEITNTVMQSTSGHDYMLSFKTLSECFQKLTLLFSEKKMTSASKLTESIEKYINEHYTEPDISLKQVAEELHFSYNYLCRFFKQAFGCVFIDYLRNIRINKAKELLLYTDKSITEIASFLGFLTSTTFIKTFKASQGMTPGDYRKNDRK